jgi:hypothetical protein
MRTKWILGRLAGGVEWIQFWHHEINQLGQLSLSTRKLQRHYIETQGNIYEVLLLWPFLLQEDSYITQ